MTAAELNALIVKQTAKTITAEEQALLDATLASIEPQTCGVITGKVIAKGNPFSNNGKSKQTITVQTASVKDAKSMVFAGISIAQHDKVICFLPESTAKQAHVGGLCTISIEQRLKDATGYKDAKGQYAMHTSDHYAIEGLPTFEEHALTAETKAANNAKFAWLQEIGISKEEAIETVKARITF